MLSSRQDRSRYAAGVCVSSVDGHEWAKPALRACSPRAQSPCPFHWSTRAHTHMHHPCTHTHTQRTCTRTRTCTHTQRPPPPACTHMWSAPPRPPPPLAPPRRAPHSTAGMCVCVCDSVCVCVCVCVRVHARVVHLCACMYVCVHLSARVPTEAPLAGPTSENMVTTVFSTTLALVRSVAVHSMSTSRVCSEICTREGGVETMLPCRSNTSCAPCLPQRVGSRDDVGQPGGQSCCTPPSGPPAANEDRARLGVSWPRWPACALAGCEHRHEVWRL